MDGKKIGARKTNVHFSILSSMQQALLTSHYAPERPPITWE
jgi:hypothetical protein